MTATPTMTINPRSNPTQAPTLTDTHTLRQRAREGLSDGAVTAGYGAMREEVLAMLDAALATELVCMLRYRRHHFMASGVLAKPVADEFLVHAAQELEHADWLAARIVQLGGAPDFAPQGLAARSHAQYIEGQILAEMIRENLVAERIAIDSYRECIALLADRDPTTRRLLETILATEEAHAEELATMLQEFPAAPLLPAPQPAPLPVQANHVQPG